MDKRMLKITITQLRQIALFAYKIFRYLTNYTK